uniref:Ig-like domain-containing protein n=1 Tax=Oncorhynchus tshawytscha TaxID=74940 RepID=A0A8C8JA01_ONCTS
RQRLSKLWCRAEENVRQSTEDVMVVEGQPTTLTCQFDTADLSPNLFWYKQQTNSNPIFMLRRDMFSPGETATEFKERFDARLNVTAKSVPLMIQRVQLSDSAVYYCALKKCDCYRRRIGNTELSIQHQWCY